jgi:hypothetical protein
VLPPGLALAPTTGVISGAVSDLSGIGTANVQITAKNSDSSATASLAIVVTASVVGAVPAPVVFWASDPIRPDETVMAIAGNTSSASTAQMVALSDGPAGSPLDAMPPIPFMATVATLQASATSVKFLVPATYATGLYAFQVVEQGNPSDIGFLNRPAISFLLGDEGDSASPSGWIEVHGRNLGMKGGTPTLALVSGSSVYPLSPTAFAGNDNYCQRFAVTGVPSGTYEVYEHNGFGGPLGWAKLSGFLGAPITTFAVAAPPSWPSTVFNVGAPTGSGDDGLISAAIASATTNGGGVIQLHAGTYGLSNAIVLPNLVTLSGAGMTSTTLSWTTSPASGNLISAVTSPQYQNNHPVPGAFSVSNLTINAPSTFDGTAILRDGSVVPATFSNLTINLPEAKASMSSPVLNVQSIVLRETRNTTISNCTFNSWNNVFIRDNAEYTRVENNNFNWHETSLMEGGNSGSLVLYGNTFTLQGNALSNYYTNNDNPGMWFTGAYPFAYTSGGFHRGIYFGHNTTQHSATPPVYSVSAPYLTSDSADGFTTDLPEVFYAGGISSVSGTTVTLAGTTLAASGNFYTLNGAVLKVEGGTGAGQWATITSSNAITSATNATPVVLAYTGNMPVANGQQVAVHTATPELPSGGVYYAKTTGYPSGQLALYTDSALTNAAPAAFSAGMVNGLLMPSSDTASVFTIDHPLAIAPDATSKVTIVTYSGDLLFDGNTYNFMPTNQDYYVAMDSLKVNNTYASAEPSGSWSTVLGGEIIWSGLFYGLPLSAWHLQMLGNTNNSGVTTFLTMAGPVYAGWSSVPVQDYQVMRDNVDTGPGQTLLELHAPGSGVLMSDIVLEHNTVHGLSAGETSDQGTLSGILIRSNGAASPTAHGKAVNAQAGILYTP